jgi:hypothetical protein
MSVVKHAPAGLFALLHATGSVESRLESRLPKVHLSPKQSEQELFATLMREKARQLAIIIEKLDCKRS